ncbi:MAG: Lrp/AsnC family transcriptional regulator [Sphingomonas sp.]
MPELTSVERKMLAILQTEGDISNVELAERVGMSPSPCLRKAKALRDAGYIRDYVALLDRKKLGFQILAYVDVKVPQVANSTIVEEFRAAVMREPAIVGWLHHHRPVRFPAQGGGQERRGIFEVPHHHPAAAAGREGHELDVRARGGQGFDRAADMRRGAVAAGEDARAHKPRRLPARSPSALQNPFDLSDPGRA